MHLQGISGGVKAARAGHQVIMTPTSHCYLDYRQSLRAGEPGAWCECPHMLHTSNSSSHAACRANLGDFQEESSLHKMSTC